MNVRCAEADRRSKRQILTSPRLREVPLLLAEHLGDAAVGPVVADLGAQPLQVVSGEITARLIFFTERGLPLDLHPALVPVLVVGHEVLPGVECGALAAGPPMEDLLDRFWWRVRGVWS